MQNQVVQEQRILLRNN